MNHRTSLLSSLISCVGFALLGGALLGLSGCAALSDITGLSSFRREMVYATGEGEGSAKGRVSSKQRVASERGAARRHGANYPTWASKMLDVQTSAPLSSEATSHVEALALARQGAREKAFRELAGRIAALPAPGNGGSVGKLLAGRPDDKADVEKIIRGAEFTKDAEGKSGDYVCAARLSLDPIASLLFAEADEQAQNAEAAKAAVAPSPRDVKIPTDPAQRKAFDAALVKARANMMEQLKKSVLAPNYTVADMMAAGPEPKKRAQVALDYAVETARVEAIRYPRPGACQVDLSVDAGPILKSLRPFVPVK